MPLLEVSNLKKIYTTRFGNQRVTALSDVSFSVEQGEFVAIMGESGSGKTTLLNMLATIDTPTAGDISLDGVPFRDMGDAATFRRRNLGFVFQDFNLLDTFSVQDNILLPLVLSNTPLAEMTSRLTPLAEKLGIAEILEKFPYEISGGQKQRTAVARAVITKPRLLLADEPTGALDSRAATELLDLFGALHREGQTVLMVTHSVQAASRAARVLFIKDGEVFHQLYKASSTDEEQYRKIADTLTAIATGGMRNA